MFADEEFDLDEDFLNELTQKESQYYSQRLSSDEERCVKKFKNDENRTASITSCNESIANLDESFDAISQKNIAVMSTSNRPGCDKKFRTNSILERLKRHKTSTNSGQNEINKPTISPKVDNSAQESCSKPKNNNDSRKNLILEIFRKNNIESSSAGPSTSSEIKPIENNVSLDNRKIEQCKTVGKYFTKSTKPVHKPVTLVRQFPGPAGLLPDLSNESIPQALLELSHSDDSNNCIDVDTADESSVISNYYSQNTTSLFNDGPWQSLIDDLDDGFLNGHEISMIKQKVLTNSYKNNKVPFLAGIVQKVDFGRPDPTVVLKDCTGSIEGTISKDILLKYPQSLDIGAVLFLGNVGLLTVGSYLKKFHVVVTMKNILNVYAGKTKIFNTSEMNARLEDLINDSRYSERVLNRVSDSSHSLNSKFNSRQNIENVRVNESRNSAFNSRNSNNSYSSLNNSSNHTAIANKLPIVTNNNSTSDNSLINKVKAKSPETKNVDHKTVKSTFETENFEDFDDEFTASFLEMDDRMISEMSVDKVSTKDSVAKSKGNTVPKSVNIIAKNNPMVFNSDAKKSETVEQKVTTANEKQSPAKSSNVKLKLSVFRSNSELTPPNSEDIDSIISENNTAESTDNQKENKNKFQSNSMSDMLLNKENDSDEEIFSQLDIESIVSNYNNLNNVN